MARGNFVPGQDVVTCSALRYALCVCVCVYARKQNEYKMLKTTSVWQFACCAPRRKWKNTCCAPATLASPPLSGPSPSQMTFVTHSPYPTPPAQLPLFAIKRELMQLGKSAERKQVTQYVLYHTILYMWSKRCFYMYISCKVNLMCLDQPLLAQSSNVCALTRPLPSPCCPRPALALMAN